MDIDRAICMYREGGGRRERERERERESFTHIYIYIYICRYGTRRRDACGTWWHGRDVFMYALSYIYLNILIYNYMYVFMYLDM